MLYSLKRPITFDVQPTTADNANNLGTAVNDVLTNAQNALGIHQPIIFREPLPELPMEALTQNLLVLPKFDIKAPI
ncbi:MAG: hypothetical protein WC422_03280 [Candidatus Paceibacterota bacterium]